jgi:hypothetical protein
MTANARASTAGMAPNRDVADSSPWLEKSLARRLPASETAANPKDAALNIALNAVVRPSFRRSSVTSNRPTATIARQAISSRPQPIDPAGSEAPVRDFRSTMTAAIPRSAAATLAATGHRVMEASSRGFPIRMRSPEEFLFIWYAG